jgi:hypothetical protein
MRRLAPPLVLAALVAVVAGWFVCSRPLVVAAAPASAATSRTPQLQGVASCASMACHHANGPRGSWRSEYTTWATVDPHARAYTVLFEKRSLTIEKNFKGLADLQDARPEKDGLCLNCHVQPRLEETGRHERFSLIDGVGCEACHGAAENWISRHYTDEWRGKTAADKARLGMTNTKDLRVRAEVCVACHVGSGDSDVNHDLIAAGHPRLRFEFGAYLANYPKHWSEKKDKEGHPDFEAQAWMIGQLVSAEAALKLLEQRAHPEAKPWPEFAEYDCSACHHSLMAPSWRQQASHPERKAGELPWGSWYLAMPQAVPSPSGVALDAPVKELGALMAAPYPDAAKVRAAAHRAEEALAQWRRQREQAPAGPALVQTLTRSLANMPDDQVLAGPDQLTQFYLLAAALHHALSDLDRAHPNVPRREAVLGLGKRLDGFYVSPDGTRYDTPRFLDREGFDEVKKRVEQLRPMFQLN